MADQPNNDPRRNHPGFLHLDEGVLRPLRTRRTGRRFGSLDILPWDVLRSHRGPARHLALRLHIPIRVTNRFEWNFNVHEPLIRRTHCDVIESMYNGVCSVEDINRLYAGKSIDYPCSVPPSTEVLERNDISCLTKQAYGYDRQSNVKGSVPSMIHSRQLGSRLSPNPVRCLSGDYLPNTYTVMKRFWNEVYCCIYSKTGDILAVTGQDKDIRLYQVRNGIYTMLQHYYGRHNSYNILDLALSPDGQHVACSRWSLSGADPFPIEIHPIQGDSLQQNMKSPSWKGYGNDRSRLSIFSIAFFNDSKTIVGGGNLGSIHLYDVERDETVKRFEGHADDVNAVGFADDSCQVLYTGGDDGICKVWDTRTLRVTTPRPVGVLAGHIHGIVHLDSRGDSRYLITNSKDQTIKLWDIRALTSSQAARQFEEIARLNNRELVSHGNPGTMCRYPKIVVPGDTSVMTYNGHIVSHTLIRSRFSPAFTTGQRFIYTGCATGKVIIYDILTGKVIGRLRGPKSIVRDASWHPERHEIIAGAWDSTIGLFRYVNTDPEALEID